jgi:hypothetical protein
MEERSRRIMLAQGLAALACFIAVHGAHAAAPAATRSPATKPVGHAQVDATARTPSRSTRQSVGRPG